jgi:uncharacterized protein (TIGR03085 family)
MTNWAQEERSALCDLLLERGPDAPTLCGGWTARDLAAHLVIRERRPDAALGIVVSLGPLATWTERVQSHVAGQPFDRLVAQVRNGPPVWSPTRITAVDSLTNTAEFFVHHEDVRRAQDGWEPRELPEQEQDALWSMLRRMKMLVRSSPVGLTFQRPAGDRFTAKQAGRAVTVSGEPAELVLFAFGRSEQARVELAGEDDAVAELRAARFGI